MKFTVKQCRQVTFQAKGNHAHSLKAEVPGISGTELTIENASSRPVPCFDGDVVYEKSTRKDSEVAINAIFIRSTGAPCPELVGQTLEKYRPFICCDTVPAKGNCLVPMPVVEKVPADLQRRRASRIIGLSDPSHPQNAKDKPGIFKVFRKAKEEKRTKDRIQ